MGSKIVFQRSWAFSVWAEAISSISSLLLVRGRGGRHPVLPVPQFGRWQHYALPALRLPPSLQHQNFSHQVAVSKQRLASSNLRLEALELSILLRPLLRVLHLLTTAEPAAVELV